MLVGAAYTHIIREQVWLKPGLMTVQDVFILMLIGVWLVKWFNSCYGFMVGLVPSRWYDGSGQNIIPAKTLMSIGPIDPRLQNKFYSLLSDLILAEQIYNCDIN